MKLWSDCLEILRDEIPSGEFSAFLQPVKAQMNGENELILITLNQSITHHIKVNYLNRIIQIVKHISKNNNLQVNLKELQEQNTTTKPQGIKHGINHNQTFDNFIASASNILAKTTASDIAESPGKMQYNPFSLYGSTGLGKTHLLHAIGNAILKKNPKAKIRYITGERFMTERGISIQKKEIENFKSYFRNLDVLMLDDIQFLMKYTSNNSPEEFLNIFNALQENNKQLIVVSDVYPVDIPNIDPRIKSRLVSGLCIQIEPPDFEARKKILKQKALDLHNINLPDDTAGFIAQNLRTNVRVLEGAINTLCSWCKAVQNMPTIDNATARLNDMFRSHNNIVTIESIQKIVAEFYKIEVADLISKSRKQSVTRPRQIAMALAKELTSNSLPDIGNRFGGRDHTTVLHSCRTVAELKENNLQLLQEYNELIQRINS